MAQPNPRLLTERELLRFVQKSEHVQKIIAHVSKTATVKELTMKIGIDNTTIHYHLIRFLENHVVSRSGKYNMIYTLTEKGYALLEKIRPTIYHLL